VVGNAARLGEMRHGQTILVGKPHGRRSLGKRRRKWEDNIKMDLSGIRCRIQLALRFQWRAVMVTVMNFLEA
jgi:hypothetical protein